MIKLSAFASKILEQYSFQTSDIAFHFNISEKKAAILADRLKKLCKNEASDFSLTDNGYFKSISVKLPGSRSVILEMNSSILRFTTTNNSVITAISEAMYDTESIHSFEASVDRILNNL